MRSAPSTFGRRHRPDLVRIDQLAALVLLAGIALNTLLAAHVHQAAIALIAGTVLAGSVASRRRRPFAAVLAALIALVVQRALGAQLIDGNPAAIALAILLFYGAGAFLDTPRAQIAIAASLAASAAAILSDNPVSALPYKLLFPVALPWVLGRVVRAHEARERGDREAAERLDAGRELYAQAAAESERARIARELHDVIAHSVSVMVIQAGGARLVMDAEPDRADSSLRAVERSGREALAEMRRLLGVLDADRAQEALAPQPGLHQLEALLASTRASGLMCELRVHGEPAPVSQALDLCAYRIVQEALTNTIKHAGPTRATVLLDWTEASLELEITDEGGCGGGANTHGGHGLAGMRERAALHGGSVEASSRHGGGFSVRACLPLEREPVR
jgi:signal transduction histidine kinase